MIPDKVKIGWRVYDIEQSEHRTGDNGCDLYGEINYEGQKIFIYDKLSEDNKSATLLHEILHGVFYISGHEEWRKNEELIDCITENLYQVIKDNPKLFKEESNEATDTTA
jgi:hypothetical protein